MKRRKFLKTGALSLPMLMGLQHLQAASPSSMNWDQTLILLELKGGNDGLNTIIPYADGHYYDNRPSIAIAENEVLHLNDELGFHPALADFKDIWDEGDLAVILGLGYPEPNRSHFRSIDIWDSASDSSEFLSEGWVSQLLTREPEPENPVWVDGLILGGGDAGPLNSTLLRTLSMDTADSFLSGASDVPSLRENADLPVLNHLIQVQNTIFDSVGTLQNALAEGNEPVTEFPNTSLGRSFRQLAILLANGVRIPAVKISHGSFDTHSNQLGTQNNLLSQLNQALAAFRLAMIEIGMWNQVAIQTYAEFGRRVEGNASAGTDHGTAAPHFLMGGSVRGGFHGVQPSLTDLDGNGDLIFTTDFRALYASIASGFWKLEDPFDNRFQVMDLFT
jgi:uncharacterized protein (DUF1501 family)